jgi:hypothetical protein
VLQHLFLVLRRVLVQMQEMLLALNVALFTVLRHGDVGRQRPRRLGLQLLQLRVGRLLQ